MTTRETEVFNLIKHDPMISQEQIAATLGITRSAVSVYVSSLIKQGYIKGRGYVVSEENDTVVIGVAGVDIVGSMLDYPGSSAVEHIFAQIGDISVSFGGAGRNIAEYMARLGSSVKLVSAIAADMFGKQLMQDCEELHIDSSASLHIAGGKQDMMVQLRDPRDHSHRCVLNYRTGELLTQDFLKSQYAPLNASGRIIVTDILTPDAAEYLLCTFPNKEIWCILSGVLERLDSYRDILSRFSHVYLNAKTAAHLLNYSNYETTTQFARKLSQTGMRNIYVSSDNHQLLHITQGGAVRYELPGGIISDSERGKDAFVAGLINGSACCRTDINETIRFAAACSAVQIEIEQNSEVIFSPETVTARMTAQPLPSEILL